MSHICELELTLARILYVLSSIHTCRVAEITGDIDNSKCMQYLAKASIIVTTVSNLCHFARTLHVFIHTGTVIARKVG